LGFKSFVVVVIVGGGGLSDTVASGRTSYVTFKDPKALEIAIQLSVWIQIMMGDI